MKTKVPYGMKDYTIHGTELEPFHIYHQIYEHGGLQVPFHWHKEMEWIWVEKGSLELTLGTQRKILQKQDFVMINSYELHQLRSIGNTSSIHHALVFLPNMLAFSYPDHCQISYILVGIEMPDFLYRTSPLPPAAASFFFAKKSVLYIICS